MADNAALVVKSSTVDPGSAVCPPWCVGEVHLDGHQLHEGTRVEWAGPGRRMRAGDSAALSASIALLLENAYEGLQPEIWFGTDGDWCELDLPGLDEVIKELENYTVALNALRYRYAAVLASADLASKPLDSAAPRRLVEITSPRPAQGFGVVV